MASLDNNGASLLVSSLGGSVSRDDIRNTLRTFFHSQASKAHSKNTSTSLSKLPVTSATGRKKVFSFIQVQNQKTSLVNKRIFGGASKSNPINQPNKKYILCVTIQEAASSSLQTAAVSKSANVGASSVAASSNVVVMMHYLRFLSNFTVEIRESWDIAMLDAIENNGLSSEKKRGSFTLIFEDMESPYQWLIDDSEGKFAMQEFVWSLCALSIDKKRMLPKLVRFNLQELNETAIHLNLQKKYGVDVDLLDHMATVKNQRLSKGEELNAFGGDMTELRKGTTGLLLSQAESDDCAALLSGVNWNICNLQEIEDDLKRKLRTLEEENLNFLLSFEGKASTSGTTTSGGASSNLTTSSIERIVVCIEALSKSINRLQEWTNECDEMLGKTSMNMMHFESLNNQLEVHFKNTVALEEMLEEMMNKIELSREQMSILLKHVDVFQDDNENGPGATETSVRVKPVIETVNALDVAIKSASVFPAKEMIAFRMRGDELAKISKSFCEKICVAFDSYLQKQVKLWLKESAQNKLLQAESTAASKHSPSKSSRSSNLNFDRDTSTGSQDSSRLSRAGTSFEGDSEVDWTLSNGRFHSALLEYRELFSRIQALDPRAMQVLRVLYAKSVSQVYIPHFHALFRSLRDKLPKASKSSIAIQSWNVHLSSSQLTEAMGATALLQLALDHIVPLCTQEQSFVRSMFFNETSNSGNEPEELVLLMENVCDKLLKRLTDFGEAAAAKNVLDALSLVVMVNSQLESIQSQSEFLFGALVSFQLQMKRLLMKFTEDQEAWINSKNVDTRMAGVLGPIEKTMVIITRLEEAVTDKNDKSMLVSIYNRMLPCTIQWLERMSEAKPKYLLLTRLENFFFMHEKLQALDTLDHHSPLSPFALQTRSKYEENALLYVQWIWESELKPLTVVFASVEALQKTLPASEIHFHVPRLQVRKAIEMCSPEMEKSVKAMHDRMKKHFSNNSKMLPIVWRVLQEFAYERYVAFDHMATDCYQLAIDPSPQHMRDLLIKF